MSWGLVFLGFLHRREIVRVLGGRGGVLSLSQTRVRSTLPRPPFRCFLPCGTTGCMAPHIAPRLPSPPPLRCRCHTSRPTGSGPAVAGWVEVPSAARPTNHSTFTWRDSRSSHCNVPSSSHAAWPTARNGSEGTGCGAGASGVEQSVAVARGCAVKAQQLLGDGTARLRRQPRGVGWRLQPLALPERDDAVVGSQTACPYDKKTYGRSHTILIAMSRALSSGCNTIGNTVDPMISIPGTLLPTGFAACWEPLPRRSSFSRLALPPQDWTLLQTASDV